MLERDSILLCDDAALSARCELFFCLGSGHGGQKRNKTSSAVRVRLKGTDFEAVDCSGRSQHQNRAAALRKLRMKIAFSVRGDRDALPRKRCSPEHAEYPLFVASLFDVLAVHNWEIAPAAEKLAVTPTSLLKALSRDAAVWQAFGEKRRAAGLPLLKGKF